MSKISAEQVVEAFETMGLKAKRKKFFSSNNCACGLGALWAKETKYVNVHSGENLDQIQPRIIYNIYDVRFGTQYVNGFISGFDGGDKEEKDNELFVEGYADGESAYEAVLAKGLVADDAT